MTGARAPATEAGGTGAPLEWTYNPWRERPGLATAGGVSALLLCVLAAGAGEGPILTLGLCVAGVASLSPLFAPSRCRVTEDGVARRGPMGWSRRPWRAIRRAAAGPGGVLVSPYARRHWLEPWRSLFLPLPAGCRDALLPELRARLAEHGLGG